MKKYLLVALNSQYIHTNLAVRYIKKYVEENNEDSQKSIEIYESNINNQLINIVRDIYEKSP
ncbi:MAG: B12-binding domain-containing radical SAM protein, partial [Fusobacteriaceae bacterium]